MSPRTLFIILSLFGGTRGLAAEWFQDSEQPLAKIHQAWLRDDEDLFRSLSFNFLFNHRLNDPSFENVATLAMEHLRERVHYEMAIIDIADSRCIPQQSGARVCGKVRDLSVERSGPSDSSDIVLRGLDMKATLGPAWSSLPGFLGFGKRIQWFVPLHPQQERSLKGLVRISFQVESKRQETLIGFMVSESRLCVLAEVAANARENIYEVFSAFTQLAPTDQCPKTPHRLD